TQFLICDEATAQLDATTQRLIWQQLLQEVKSRQLGILVISHQIELLQALCQKIVIMPESNANNGI
ncbi:ABC transporter ATP-binding protein, partial [Vibrio parahaemolyticus]|nr:ABC transporter ATP-binding protein [Vibrio parahaemolyticus]